GERLEEARVLGLELEELPGHVVGRGGAIELRLDVARFPDARELYQVRGLELLHPPPELQRRGVELLRQFGHRALGDHELLQDNLVQQVGEQPGLGLVEGPDDFHAMKAVSSAIYTNDLDGL